MTDSVIFSSLLAGIILAEITARFFGGLWFLNQLVNLGAFIQIFQLTDGDDARQALLLRSGRTTLQFSLAVLGVLFGVTGIWGFAPWLLNWTESQQMVYLVTSSAFATAWWFLRRTNRSDNTCPARNAYGVLDRVLHWLMLEPAVVRHLAFELERQFALHKRIAPDSLYSGKAFDTADGAVYVCGLARSGTTMLLRILDQIEVFRSLTYRDMPFVLAPNLWKQISRHSSQQLALSERAHGDGILVDLDSPEGFEEVFWRTFGVSKSDSRCLSFEEPSSEVLSAFADYRSLVANPRTESTTDSAQGKLRRYLSKNNNNLLRLHSLCADPAATVLLAYRNPVATALSLYRQHQRFCVAQTEDRFTRTYMRWLVHHEFGLDHFPFCFAVPEMDDTLTPDDPNYWLDYWNAVYCYVLAENSLRLHLVNHDMLRAEPTKMLTAIFAEIGVQADSLELAQQIKSPASEVETSLGFCSNLLLRAEATHRALLLSPKNIHVNV